LGTTLGGGGREHSSKSQGSSTRPGGCRFQIQLKGRNQTATKTAQAEKRKDRQKKRNAVQESSIVQKQVKPNLREHGVNRGGGPFNMGAGQKRKNGEKKGKQLAGPRMTASKPSQTSGGGGCLDDWQTVQKKKQTRKLLGGGGSKMADD